MGMNLIAQIGAGGAGGGGLVVLIILPVFLFLVVQFILGVRSWSDESKRSGNIARVSAPAVVAGLIFAVWVVDSLPRWQAASGFRDTLSLSIGPDEMFDELNVRSGGCGSVSSRAAPLTVIPASWRSGLEPDRLDIARADARAFVDEGWEVQRYVEREPEDWPLPFSVRGESTGFAFVARKEGTTTITFQFGFYSQRQCGLQTDFDREQSFWTPVSEFPPTPTVSIPWNDAIAGSEQQSLRELIPDQFFGIPQLVNAQVIIGGQPGHCSTPEFSAGRITGPDRTPQEALSMTETALTNAGWVTVVGGQGATFITERNGEYISGTLSNDALLLRRYPAGCGPLSVGG